MKFGGKLYLSVQENACVILWGFSDQRLEDSFDVSNFWLAKMKSDYEMYDKNELWWQAFDIFRLIDYYQPGEDDVAKANRFFLSGLKQSLKDLDVWRTKYATSEAS